MKLCSLFLQFSFKLWGPFLVHLYDNKYVSRNICIKALEHVKLSLGFVGPREPAVQQRMYLLTVWIDWQTGTSNIYSVPWDRSQRHLSSTVTMTWMDKRHSTWRRRELDRMWFNIAISSRLKSLRCRQLALRRRIGVTAAAAVQVTDSCSAWHRVCVCVCVCLCSLARRQERYCCVSRCNWCVAFTAAVSTSLTMHSYSQFTPPDATHRDRRVASIGVNWLVDNIVYCGKIFVLQTDCDRI